jgi:BirA family biotin operon repressor/biotin-[acetyl-CoA-carboxylase] ligase
LVPYASPIGQSFIELQTVDSTNNYATAQVHAGMAQHGTVVFAHQQTRGRGQRNNQWQTGEQNIAMSVVLQPYNLELSKMFLLSMATAVGVQQFFNNYTLGEVCIKWPNDIYWRDRKAGGILIENMVSGTQWRYAVAGIGININQTHFEGLDQRAVSLKQITGKTFDPVVLAKELCNELEVAYEALVKNEIELVQKYHAALYKKDKKVKLKQATRTFEAVIKGVTINGQLITEHAVEEMFDVGEIEWVF